MHILHLLHTVGGWILHPPTVLSSFYLQHNITVENII